MSQSAALFDQLKSAVDNLSADKKSELQKKLNAVFEIAIKKGENEHVWTLDFKDAGRITEGPAPGKADIRITTDDDTFANLASGKLNGQKAFMQGKLKVKGNMMLATKLDELFKVVKTSPAASAPAKAASAPVAASGGAQDFQSAGLFAEMKRALASLPGSDSAALKKKGNAIFQFDVKNAGGKVQSWTLDLKTNPSVQEGAATGVKPDIIISIGDKELNELAQGKLNGQKAFMQGKLKVKGNMMLATKLDGILKDLKPKAKL
ncbi:hypothetical protein HK097_006084 [Rhizophlyctis rosea]|uniref:SCP2 domain-containing protein n=1 Tax=Rhizophlyctis rosea TaxID=64517 RepID=A0AAD5SD32_9FUNG|nr:hypothetical protein HK097_006084 [Rhizophlyctis rosea]